ncbi:protein ABIL2-like isoform X1 [Zingiber officinale]|uniref:protein ABIL2-like isoform X1 n=1 Tax=Zingiber officinale TaxID=94328 RepID=UPI001C4C4F02|nr:protein ABIL2-like isoform X1 [Zingiber officinale]
MITSPSASSMSANLQEESSLDVSIPQNQLLSESLKGLRNMRSQLYSAAEYFELSYKNDDKKELISKTLKSYTLETLADAVNRLGLVSNNVNNLLHQEVNEISAAEFQVSCIEQRFNTFQACLDKEGLHEQSHLIKSPKHHKHYILQGDEPMQTYEGIHPPQEASKLRKHKTAARRRLPPPPPVLSSYTLTWPLPRLGKTFLDKSKLIAQLQEDPNCALYDMERRENSQLQANRPFISDSWPKYNLEPQHSLPVYLHDGERIRRRETEEGNRRKKRGFFKGLFSRKSSWTDEPMYNYLDEY